MSLLPRGLKVLLMTILRLASLSGVRVCGRRQAPEGGPTTPMPSPPEQTDARFGILLPVIVQELYVIVSCQS